MNRGAHGRAGSRGSGAAASRVMFALTTAVVVALTIAVTAVVARRLVPAGGTAAADTVTPLPPAPPIHVRLDGPRVATALDLKAPPPEGTPTWVTRSESMMVGSVPRRYLVVRPSSSITGERLPVLVVLHGRTMTPEAAVTTTGFESVVGRAVLVYPEGYDLSWNAGACCGEAWKGGVDDVAFISAVVHDVLASEPDTSAGAVFLAGYSNGGRMAYRMACAEPGLFSAVAAAEATSVYPCAHPRPMRLIQIASTGDPLLTIDAEQPRKIVNDFLEPSITDVAGFWRTAGGCAASPRVAAGAALTTRRWEHCLPGGDIELDLYQGGSHAWPDGGDGVPSAQHLIWRFFQSQTTQTG